MIKNLIKFCYKLRSRKTISAKSTSSTASTYKATCVTFEKYFKLNYEKKISQKQLSLKNWKKLLNFLILQKTYKSKEKFPSAKRVSR